MHIRVQTQKWISSVFCWVSSFWDRCARRFSSKVSKPFHTKACCVDLWRYACCLGQRALLLYSGDRTMQQRLRSLKTALKKQRALAKATRVGQSNAASLGVKMHSRWGKEQYGNRKILNQAHTCIVNEFGHFCSKRKSGQLFAKLRQHAAFVLEQTEFPFFFQNLFFFQLPGKDLWQRNRLIRSAASTINSPCEDTRNLGSLTLSSGVRTPRSFSSWRLLAIGRQCRGLCPNMDNPLNSKSYGNYMEISQC